MSDIKIIDCFIFYNELRMLEFRLAELDDVVDYFVLVEATHTHSGDEKELFFDKNKDRYSKYLNKIIHVIVDDMPNTEDAWYNERFHRQCIDRGVKQIQPNDTDIILISDVDEIPDSNTLKKVKGGEIVIVGNFKLVQDLYYYNINTRSTENWYRARIVDYYQYRVKYKKGHKKNRQGNPNHIRCAPNSYHLKAKGGWHFSYFMDPEAIANKIKNFGHQEFNTKKYTGTDTIKQKIESGTDLFSREESKFDHIKIEDNDYLPKHYEMLLN